MDARIELHGVTLVHKTDLVLVYSIDGRDVRIPPLHILSGTTANRVGEQGTLVIPKWLAEELGIAAQ